MLLQLRSGLGGLLYDGSGLWNYHERLKLRLLQRLRVIERRQVRLLLATLLGCVEIISLVVIHQRQPVLLVGCFHALLDGVPYAQHLHRELQRQGLVLIEQEEIELDLAGLFDFFQIETALNAVDAAWLLAQQQRFLLRFVVRHRQRINIKQYF